MKITAEQVIQLVEVLAESLAVRDNAGYFQGNKENVRRNLLDSIHTLNRDEVMVTQNEPTMEEQLNKIGRAYSKCAPHASYPR